MDVTVITMTYLRDRSRLKWLKETIDSVLCQEGVEFEYIIVNDGSLLDVPSAWLSDKRIKYFKREHKNRAYASNFGTTQGVGKYRCFVADDDYLLGTDSLAVRFKLAEENPKVSLLWTNGYKVTEKRKKIREFRAPGVINGVELIKRGGLINGTTAIINRELWLKFKLDTAYTTAEEFDQQIRLAKWSEDNGYRFQYFPQYYTAVNRQHPKQGSKNLSPKQKKMRRDIVENGKKLFGVK